jgi:hypothetical protein
MTSLADLQTALFKPARQIGPYSTASFPLPDGIEQFEPFTAQAVIEETHVDELEITQHPVEHGAAISDHAYKKPCEIILRLAWSNSSLQSLGSDVSALNSLFSGNGEGGFSYVQEIYNKLLNIQLSRVPIGIVTGKRVYSNMLIRSLTAPTNKETEHALFITMACRQIIVAHTFSQSFTDSTVQANPSVTGQTQDMGTKQAVPTNKLFEGIQ